MKTVRTAYNVHDLSIRAQLKCQGSIVPSMYLRDITGTSECVFLTHIIISGDYNRANDFAFTDAVSEFRAKMFT